MLLCDRKHVRLLFDGFIVSFSKSGHFTKPQLNKSSINYSSLSRPEKQLRKKIVSENLSSAR